MNQSQLDKQLEIYTRTLRLRDALKKQEELKKALPHLYFPHYKWSRSFVDSTNRVNLLTAANQIGKSSAAIRRCIQNATDPQRWDLMWGADNKPTMFWYFYPDMATIEREFQTKWRQWLPQGKMEFDARFGWKLERTRGEFRGISFNSGVRLYFLSYGSGVKRVQAGTVHEVTSDEELPVEYYDELMLRLTRTNGIFNAVFTPTLNQQFWREVMESSKRLPNAFKQQVSMYDCLTYEDGTPSGTFTAEKIQEIIEKCKNETEVQRRVFGRFVSEEGLAYYAFDPEKHRCQPHDITGWQIYAAVDPGSGGKNHPAGIIFIAVRPDMRAARIFKAWRGDQVETTAGDVLAKYRFMRDTSALKVVQAWYDHSTKDFGLIASRSGENFTMANKSRELGEETVNTLFKYDMLKIFEGDDELDKLVSELMFVKAGITSRMGKRHDDLVDPLRYACMGIPWDWTVTEELRKVEEAKIEGTSRPLTEAEVLADQIRQRRGDAPGKQESGWDEYYEEIEFWNEQY
jgi:phage terminase large subunit-like protein